MNTDQIKSAIELGLKTTQVNVEGDGTHFQALVVSQEFSGKSQVQRHQMVYKTLGSKVGGEIHALSIKALTPEEWENRKQFHIIQN